MPKNLKPLFFFLIILPLVFVNCKKEEGFYRLIDRLETKNILSSPLMELDQKFQSTEQTWSENEMLLLEGGERKVQAIPAESLLLEWDDQQKPRGMTVYKDGVQLKHLLESSSDETSWSWRRIDELIEPERYRGYKRIKKGAVLLPKKKYFVSKEVFIPEGEVTFEITASSMDGMKYLPMLEISLNDESIGEIPICIYQKYLFIQQIKTGRYKIKLGFSRALERAHHDSAEELLLDKIRITSSSDVILISSARENRQDKDSHYRASFSVQPEDRVTFPADFSPAYQHEVLLVLNKDEPLEKNMELRSGPNSFEIICFTQENNTFLQTWLDDKPLGSNRVLPWLWNSLKFASHVDEGTHTLKMKWISLRNRESKSNNLHIHRVITRGPQTNTLVPLHKVKYDFPINDLGIGPNPFFIKKKMEVGEYAINALFAPPRSEFEFPVRIPESGAIKFGYGVVWQTWQTKKDGVDFKILLEDSGEEKVLFSKFLASTPKNKKKEFFENDIDLSEYSGKNAKIRFVTENPQGEQISGTKNGGYLSFWFNPVIYKSKRDKSEAPGERPKILLISLDTLRADHLHCYGYPRETSPSLDELAKDSVLFTNCFSQAPYTICSHMSMLTALNPANHQVYTMENILDPSLPTFADLLRKNNYFTGAFTGGGQVSQVFGFSKGFDFYHEIKKDPWKKNYLQNLYELSSDWLSNNRNKNFFLFLHTYQIHDPYIPPEPFNKEFLAEGAKWKEIFLSRQLLDLRKKQFKAFPDAERDNIIALYDGEIKYTDECLIRPLIEKLKELDLYDRTMIIITSDHGEEFYEHGGWLHSTTLYNELIKVPLIIKFPRSEHKGEIVENIVRSIDIMPTALQEAEIDFSDYRLDGQGLAKLIRGDENGHRIFFSEINGFDANPSKISTNRDHYKFILNKKYTKTQSAYYDPPPPSVPELELYDLITDPQETKNISNSQGKMSRELLEEILKYRQQSRLLIGKEKKPILDKELQDRLRALGYIK